MNFEGVNLSPQQKLQYDQVKAGISDSSHIEITISGELNKDKLKIAVKQLITRHDVLRNEYIKTVGLVYPLQGVASGESLYWHEKSLLNSADFSSVNEQFFQNENTEQATIKCLLLNTEEAEYTLFIQLPGLILDIYTAQELVEQIYQLYHGDYDADELNEDTTQYASFVVWLEELLQDEDAIEHENFFKSLALNEQPSGELSSRRDVRDPNKSSIEYILPTEVKSQLEKLTESTGLDLERLLLASWIAVLARINDKIKFLVNWQHDCRHDYEELAQSLGLFKKSLPLAVGIDIDKSFAYYLEQFTQLTDEYLEAQEYWPANDILATKSRLPSFEYIRERTIFSDNTPSFQLVNNQCNNTAGELHLQVKDSKHQLALQLNFAAGCYSQEQMKSLLAQFSAFLTKIIVSTEQPLSHYELSNNIEQSFKMPIVAENLAFSEPSLLDVIKKNMKGKAKEIALQGLEQQYTYAELDRLSDQLAMALITNCSSGKPVAIFLPRCIESIIAIIGCWKAGSAYLPLDAGWPLERCNTILSDAQARVVVSSSQLSFDSDLTRLDLDNIHKDNIQQNKDVTVNLADIEPNEMAYLLYTSGSTGAPKGVKVTHANLHNYVLSVNQQLGLSTCKSFALTSTLAADLGNTMLFAALVNGVCLHVLTQDEVTDSRAFANYLQCHVIEAFKFVPSHLEALFTGADINQLSSAKVLVFGGEATDINLVRQIKQQVPQLAIYNHYGPTETTVGVLFHKYDEKNDYENTLPLDQIIANNSVVLINASGVQASIGEKAELYVSGANVAEGYLNNQQATELNFVKLKQYPQQVFYKTGDLARYTAEGKIQLIGRKDHQIKVRGFRVELSEIESALRQLDAVRQSAVVTHGEGNQLKLCAFIVSEQESVDLAAIKSQLNTILPNYMVPHQFHQLEVLPQLPNGKIDRQQLPSPDDLPSQQKECIKPDNEIEEILLAIWKNILDMEKLGVTWNFFEMGGHSLMAIKVVSRIRKLLHVDLPPGIMFEHSNIRALAVAAQQFETKPGQLMAIAKARKKLAIQKQNKVLED